MTEHIADEDVVEEIFAAINSLSTNSLENRNHFHIAKAEGVILKAIAKHEKVKYENRCVLYVIFESVVLRDRVSVLTHPTMILLNLYPPFFSFQSEAVVEAGLGAIASMVQASVSVNDEVNGNGTGHVGGDLESEDEGEDSGECFLLCLSIVTLAGCAV